MARVDPLRILPFGRCPTKRAGETFFGPARTKASWRQPAKRAEGGRITQKSVGNAFLAVVRAEAKLCRAKFEATREARGKDFKDRIWLESRSHRGSRQNVAAWCRIERSVAFFNLENASRPFDLFQAGGAETPRASERPLWCLADALRVT
jgi:hypothetical protein